VFIKLRVSLRFAESKGSYGLKVRWLYVYKKGKVKADVLGAGSS
jgi:hypothetical protein